MTTDFCGGSSFNPDDVVPNTEAGGYDEDPAYLAYLKEMERMCGRSITLGFEDGTSCEKDAGHDGPHRGRSPFADDFVEWTGGGMCAGDPLPVRDMRFTS